MTPDNLEDIAYEMNRELGQAEQREIARRVERALTDHDDPGADLPEPRTDGGTMSDRLSEIEGRLAAATPGVWKLWGMDVLADQDGTSDVDTAVPVATTHMLIDGKPRTFNAELIAHAPADLAVLVKFAREVEARHRPVHPDWVRPGDRVCEECTDAAAYAAGVSYVPWPCPTAAALERMGDA